MRGDKARQNEREKRKSNEQDIQHTRILPSVGTSIIARFALSVA